MQRRQFVAAAAAVPLVPLAGGVPAAGAFAASAALSRIEATTGGRLGVAAAELAGGRRLGHRVGEGFPMCSTFKMLLVTAVLARVDAGRERLDREIAYGRADLQAYAPVTTAHVRAGSMSIGALCAAAIVVSDNTAASLLFRSIGGPLALTAFVRRAPFRDPVTRFDRTEPALNSALPGDPRDTTTPARMAAALALVLGGEQVLAAPSRYRLAAWMHACETGRGALRAGVPPSWAAADKTGSGANGTRNDLAIFRPTHRPAIVVAAYLTGATSLDDTRRDAALAAVGHVVARAFA